MLFRSRTGALVLIIVGTLFLLSNLGWIPQLGPFFHRWWPLILIIVGIVMLVQPWSIDLYGYSFVTILVGTLGYVAVSHFPE